jgi:indolepyruvate ferredoxin oxidoreductase alpha subunit
MFPVNGLRRPTLNEVKERLTLASDAPGQRMFLLGNEAIARGAIEAGVQVAAAYPGTPSSEIMENLAKVAKELGIYAEWSVNEKVAFEVALAASISGLRAMASMKHVGLNVAHDPVMTASYIGAKGGLVLLVADDPWAWSSQNEQDNRYVAEQGYIPVLEPSSIQEAKDMMADAFRLSEEFKQMFMVRSVTRIAHGRSNVVLGEMSREQREGSFQKNTSWLVYTPAGARKNKPLVLRRFEMIKEAVNSIAYNQLKLVAGAKLGIIACGLSYSYTREALRWLGLEDKVSVLKVGTPNPLPEKLVRELLKSAEEVLVVEELDPFVETHVKTIVGGDNIPVKVFGKNLIPRIGELTTRKVCEAIAALTKSKLPMDFKALDKLSEESQPMLPDRPPALCPGCPHRASFYTIKMAAKRVARDMGKDVESIYPGDIGCYTLAVNPPLEGVDTTICMGGSFGIANGLSHSVKAPIIASLGDSTFFHSGIPPMINAVYNQANITMVVLDNSATAMTGFQPHPGTGSTATGDEAPVLKIEDIARACGVKFVEIIDPFDLKNAIDTFEKAIRFEGPALVVSRRLCAMVEQREKRKKGEKATIYRVDAEKCRDKCETCIAVLGCPAITRDGTKATIDSFTCTGCGVCAQICPYKAIMQE